MGRIQEYSMINCAVNAQCARERFNAYEPVRQKKTVLIVGGGIAGCEAARVLAIRGHKPVILEAGDHLGGAFTEAGVPSFKEDDRALIKWFETELRTLGVEIRFNTLATPGVITQIPHDTVIVATGAKARTFDLGEALPALTARDVLAARAENTGSKIVVIGGGMVGCELALWLTKDLHKDVTIVEALPKLLAVNAPICSANREMLERLVPFHGSKIYCDTKAVKTISEGLLAENVKTGEQELIPADTVIFAVGFKSDRELYEALSEEPELYLIGDAKEFHNVHSAVWDAFEVANHI